MPHPRSSHAELPSASQQLGLLLGLWWRHMRRRALRVGDAPKLSGVPTSLLLNLLSMFYLAPVAWRAVAHSMRHDPAFFAWHLAGVLMLALGTGTSKAATALQVRGTRNDAFLEPLPLMTLARLGLQLADGFFLVPLALVVPLAGAAAHRTLGWGSTSGALLGLFAYVAFFVAAQALVAWARALGPPSTARRSAYAGIGLYLSGFVVILAPVDQFFGSAGGVARWVTRWWLRGGVTLGALYAGTLILGWAAYVALLAAERVGFDHHDTPLAAPPAYKGTQSRIALEWLMMWRQGGKALLILFTLIGLAFAWLLVRAPREVPEAVLALPAGLIVYLGAIQTIAHAGRAARSDLMARAFLAALPLSPHHVLEGKARALRKLLIPILSILALIAAVGVWHDTPSITYRMALAALSLYVVVDGAVSIAFLSNGIGVAGVGGGQASSSFSTQLLMMPLLATVMAVDNWAATVSFIAVVAVTWESRRAAHKSVRWLDDPADDVERETTVWRALLAATAFFALQAITFRMLDLFDVPTGYTLAIAFGAGSSLLALLTWRNGARFERPRFWPLEIWAWPLGMLAGGVSGTLALGMAKLLPKPPEEAALQISSTGEVVAVFVTLVVMAPLAEEYFFRGWLQRAIEQDLPVTKKHWAFALGALAFALAHVGTYGIPQLVLGLLAGALYAWGGGLWPAILAHAIHNGLVLLAAGS
jgi:membrane protease YdiL (CAAX protease family)